MTRLIITHGRSQEFETPATLERQWSEDLRWGLERVDAPFAAGIPIDFAFYGDHWRDDAGDLERAAGAEPPTDFQLRLAGEMLAAAPADADREIERLGWDTLAGLVGTLDKTLGVGQVALRWFVKDVDRYFSDATLREKAIQRVIDAVAEEKGDIVLLAHSLGTVVAYDTLRQHPDLPVRGLVTFGSPLGLATIRARLRETGGELVFPDGVRRWANIYEKRDFVAANIPLAEHFPATDGRRVEDAQSKGRRPGVLKLVSAHDARVYLSSVALAKATRSIVESLGAGGGQERAATVPGRIPGGFGIDGDNRERPAGQVAANGGRRRSRRIPATGFDDTEQERSWEDAAAIVGDEPDNGAGPAPPTSEPTRTVERPAAASFPPLVEPGSVHDLTFQVGTAAAGDIAGGIRVDVPAGTKTLDLTVMVQAPRFEVVDDNGSPAAASMDISLDLVDENALCSGTFRLRAEETASRVSSDVRLRFLHDNNPVGTITLPTIIAKGAPSALLRAEGASGTIHHHPRVPPGAELVLYINREEDGSYEITARLEGGSERHSPIYRLGSFPVTGNAWEYAKDILEKFRTARELSKSERRTRINALGIELWRNLPDEFHEFYWKHVHDRAETILLCSDEPYIPWELIKPERSPGGKTAPMLGQAYSMARWEDERRLPASIEVADFVVVAPAYQANPLPAADVEASELASRFNARRVAPGKRAQVLRLFRSKSPQLLHFSGHGTFEDLPTDSRIALADTPLDIVDVNTATFGKQDHPPLVFFNACEIGNQGWTLTQIGGWAEAFCRAGSTGFVGPYWAVSDAVALKAALVFYRSLKAGMTVGEAMQEVRSRFTEDEQYRYHPTWLAYSLHCHPNVTVTFGDTAGT